MTTSQFPRRFPIRATLVFATMILVLLYSVVLPLAGHASGDDTVFLAFLGLVTAAIGGDTARPSGQPWGRRAEPLPQIEPGTDALPP